MASGELRKFFPKLRDQASRKQQIRKHDDFVGPRARHELQRVFKSRIGDSDECRHSPSNSRRFAKQSNQLNEIAVRIRVARSSSNHDDRSTASALWNRVEAIERRSDHFRMNTERTGRNELDGAESGPCAKQLHREIILDMARGEKKTWQHYHARSNRGCLR